MENNSSTFQSPYLKVLRFGVCPKCLNKDHLLTSITLPEQFTTIVPTQNAKDTNKMTPCHWKCLRCFLI